MTDPRLSLSDMTASKLFVFAADDKSCAVSRDLRVTTVKFMAKARSALEHIPHDITSLSVKYEAKLFIITTKENFQ